MQRAAKQKADVALIEFDIEHGGEAKLAELDENDPRVRRRANLLEQQAQLQSLHADIAPSSKAVMFCSSILYHYYRH